ncbi:hypothetical protein V6N11_080103 [Hibiscus sabdariffa]|uniref:Uncharacterized protein n=1 Tax=Hibiscus sabdariffa TaxID=183260 RepID=A0ABR2RXJ6_9ROSI
MAAAGKGHHGDCWEGPRVAEVVAVPQETKGQADGDCYLHKFNLSSHHPIEAENLTPFEHVIVPQDPYGPWMLVERKQRRQGKQQVLTNKGTVIPIDGSRFNPIYDDNANVNVQTNQSEIIFDSSPVDVNNLVLVSTPQNHILKVPCGYCSYFKHVSYQRLLDPSNSKNSHGAEVHRDPPQDIAQLDQAS